MERIKEIKQFFHPNENEVCVVGMISLKVDPSIAYVFLSTKGQSYIMTILSYRHDEPEWSSRPLERAVYGTDYDDWDYTKLDSVTHDQYARGVRGEALKLQYIKEHRTYTEQGGLNVEPGGGKNFNFAEMNKFAKQFRFGKINHDKKEKDKKIRAEAALEREIYLKNKREKEKTSVKTKREKAGF